MIDRPRIPGTLIDNRPPSGVQNSQDKTMTNAMKTVKTPLTDGFLLTDIRPRTGSSFFKAKKKTKSVITLLTGAILVFSLLMTGLPTGGHKVLADSSKTRRSP